MIDHEKKQQFNIYLPPDMIRKVKHAAVDAGQSLSDFVEQALREHLERLEPNQQESEAKPKEDKR
jgi:predicted HicB family RNase H-like nuclease